MAKQFTQALETFVGSGIKDSSGREIGWTVGLNDNGAEFAAWVQAARKHNGEFKDFGVPQRSRSFATQDAATSWAYSTAKARVAAIRQA